jgi:hypothetical protein
MILEKTITLSVIIMLGLLNGSLSECIVIRLECMDGVQLRGLLMLTLGLATSIIINMGNLSRALLLAFLPPPLILSDVFPSYY